MRLQEPDDSTTIQPYVHPDLMFRHRGLTYTAVIRSSPTSAAGADADGADRLVCPPMTPVRSSRKSDHMLASVRSRSIAPVIKCAIIHMRGTRPICIMHDVHAGMLRTVKSMGTAPWLQQACLDQPARGSLCHEDL